MPIILLEEKWKNSRGEIDGWSFVLDGETVYWSYTQLFEARTDEVSWGDATFELASFKRLLLEFQQYNKATLTVPTGGAVTLKRLLDGAIELSVHAAHGDGTTCTLKAPQPGVLVPLGVDLALVG